MDTLENAKEVLKTIASNQNILCLIRTETPSSQIAAILKIININFA